MLEFRYRNVLLGFFLCACYAAGARSAPQASGDRFEPQVLGMKIPVLTRSDQINGVVGRLVAVRGQVSESKIPRILGVEVQADESLRGHEAYAVGILSKSTVTDEQLREAEALAGGPIANDGPGVKYTLYFDLAGRVAAARPIPTE